MIAVWKTYKPSSWWCLKTFFSPQKCFHLSMSSQGSMLEEVKLRPRDVEPLPQRPKMIMEPFVKNLCVGIVDTNVLAYPELDLGRYNVLEDMVVELQKFMNSLTGLGIPYQTKMTEEVILKLKRSGIYGVGISEQYKGAGLTCVELNRIGEVLAADLSLFHALNVHISYISQIFSQYASEQQKEQYLPLLASGELQCGLAIWEKNAGVDLSNIECTAQLVDDVYKITGSKTWVNNIRFSDKFLVLAKVMVASNFQHSEIALFLVDKHSPGISSKRIETIGVNDFDLWEVNFDRTVVQPANVIGDVGKGLDIILSVLHGNFTLTGAAYASVLKRMLDITVKHVIRRDIYGQSMSSLPLVKQHLAEVTTYIYTLESMSYLTASFYDDYEKPDCAVEVAIVKLYSCEALSKGFQICAGLLGSQAYVKNSEWERMFHDAQFSMIAEHSCDYLRVLISTLCMQHVGKIRQEEITKERNPLFYPREKFEKFLLAMRLNEPDVPRIPKDAYQYLHPLFHVPSESLEHAISYLKFVSHLILVQYGADVTSKQMALARLANITVDCFAGSAVLARASRSICIGLRNNDEEFNLATGFIYDALNRVIENSRLLKESPYGTNDSISNFISDQLVSGKGYCIYHPLSRNY